MKCGVEVRSALSFLSWTGQVAWAKLCFFPVNSSLWSHVPAHQVSVVIGFFLSAIKDLNQPGKCKLFF